MKMRAVRVIAWALVVVVAVGLVAIRFFSDAPQPGGVTTDGGDDISVADGPGGPFELTAHTGERMRDVDFRGRYMLIFFGYSLCPDICPIEMEKITATLNLLEEEGLDTTPVQPLFITLDPARDTPEMLADFVGQYHPRLIGLTGSEADVDAVVKAYRVYREVVEDPSYDGYLINHLWVDFLMGPDGSFERVFTSKDTPASMADVLRPLLAS